MTNRPLHSGDASYLALDPAIDLIVAELAPVFECVLDDLSREGILQRGFDQRDGSPRYSAHDVREKLHIILARLGKKTPASRSY